jgi:pimeloyl-ACP methyl ester carboxylesterase
MCFTQELSAEDLYLMQGYNLSVPPYVRQALLSRSVDNGDLLPTIRKPVLIVHGAQDANLKLVVVDQHKAGLAHAQVQMMPNVGHGPFWDDAVAFNGSPANLLRASRGTGRFIAAGLRRLKRCTVHFRGPTWVELSTCVIRCRAP